MPFHKISEDKEPENTGGLFEIRVTKPRPTTTFTSLSLSNELKGLEDENFFEQSDFIINNR